MYIQQTHTYPEVHKHSFFPQSPLYITVPTGKEQKA